MLARGPNRKILRWGIWAVAILAPSYLHPPWYVFVGQAFAMVGALIWVAFKESPPG